jgi:hypothetical protein
VHMHIVAVCLAACLLIAAPAQAQYVTRVSLQPPGEMVGYHEMQTGMLVAASALTPVLLASLLIDRPDDPAQARRGTRTSASLGGSIGGIIGLLVAHQLELAVEHHDAARSGMLPDGVARAAWTLGPALGGGIVLGRSGRGLGLRAAAGDERAAAAIRRRTTWAIVVAVGHAAVQYVATDW